LNTLQVGLRRKVRKISPGSLVAQRLKRLYSIYLKLRRFKHLSLSEIQDIGGCRAVVPSVRDVYGLVSDYKDSRIQHELDDEDDYIGHPKKSGYRGYHLIYKYFSGYYKKWDGLKIEVQIRSPLQHAWATAVETVGAFERQALKSSRGDREWLRFFSLMGTAIAQRERTPPVPNTPINGQELVQELRRVAESLQVERKLEAYRNTLQTVQKKDIRQNSHYFLIVLDPGANKVTVTGFTSSERNKASDQYLATERAISDIAGADAVLVSVESLAALKRAYPNYFFDTAVFLTALRRAIGVAKS
jgi:hypothetical protein